MFCCCCCCFDFFVLKCPLYILGVLFSYNLCCVHYTGITVTSRHVKPRTEAFYWNFCLKDYFEILNGRLLSQEKYKGHAIDIVPNRWLITYHSIKFQLNKANSSVLDLSNQIKA